MKVAVAGSRAIKRVAPVRAAFMAAMKFWEIDVGQELAQSDGWKRWRLLSGNSPAGGVDRCGEVMARLMGMPVVRYDADCYGEPADRGRFHRRNCVMALDCDMAVVVMLARGGDFDRCYLKASEDNRGSRSFVGYMRLFAKEDYCHVYGCDEKGGRLRRLDVTRFDVGELPGGLR